MQYINQGSFQDAAVKMFWVNLVDKFHFKLFLFFRQI
jgi:hypothetical protein